MKSSKNPLTATKLRSILITVVLLMFIGTGVGFYFGYGWVAGYSNDVGATVSKANASNNLSGSLTTLQANLAKQQQVAQLANSLYANSTNWQTQAIKDINTYAQASGISVTDFTLGTGTAGSTPATTTPVAGASPAVAGATPSQTISITLSPPVSYTAFLKFMTYITYSIPKMQISGIELSRPTDGSNSISITSLSIGVYVK
jgi:hypothetical protein